MPDGEPRSPWVEDQFAAALVLAEQDPSLIALTAADCSEGAERDLQRGVTRGKAYVLRLRDLTVDSPPLGIAVGRYLGLEHIVEDLLAGQSVEGVSGIGNGGTVLDRNRNDVRRRRGVVLLVLGGLVLLGGATTADVLTLGLDIVWTVGAFGLLFTGIWLVLHRD